MTPQDREAARQLALALRRHREQAERNGGAVDASFGFLERIATFAISDDQTRSTFDGSAATSDIEPVPILAVTYRTAAAMWGVSEPTVRREIKAGRLPVCRIGGAVRVPVAALQDYITARTETR